MMDIDKIQMLRTALLGNDFTDDIIAGLKEALRELENIQIGALETFMKSHIRGATDDAAKTKTHQT